MALIDDIRRQARTEQRLIDEAADGFDRELSRVLRQTTRRIRTLLRQLETRDGRLVASQAALGRALRLRVELLAILESSGYDGLVEAAFDAPLDRLTASALRGRSLTARAARLTAIDVDILSAWQTIRTADLLELGDDFVTVVWRSTVDGLLANRTPDALVDELAALGEVTERQARTLYDTAVSTYGRQVDQLGVDPQADDRFLYVGPDDSATREFCRRHVGEVRTRAELDDLSNGQLPNTLLTAGGWNCRHKWLFLADVKEAELAA